MKKKFISKLCSTFFIILFVSSPICARMSGPAIGRAIQTLTKKYIPEAQQKDFTQAEYDQWFTKTSALYNRLKESKPDAVTRGTPSIQQLFEQVVKKQLSQLKTKAVTIPEKEALEVIITEDIQQAPSEIQDDLRETEEFLEKEIEEEVHIITSLEKKYIPEALEKDLAPDEYQTWLEEITSLYEQLEKSDPQALTQGTPSIEENLEKAVSKQLTQFEDLSKEEEIPLKEMQHIEKIIEQQTTTAPAIIQDKLKASEEKIEGIIEELATKQQEETEEITHMVKAITGAEKKEVEDDKKQAAKLQELAKISQQAEKASQERLQQEIQQTKEKLKQESLEVFNKNYNVAIEQVGKRQKEHESTIKSENNTQQKGFNTLKNNFETTLKQQKKEASRKIKIEEGKKLIDYIEQIVQDAQAKLNKFVLTDIFGLLFDDNVSLEYDLLQENFTQFNTETLNIIKQISKVSSPLIRRGIFEYYNTKIPEMAKNLAVLQYQYAEKIIKQFSDIFKKNIIDSFNYADINTTLETIFSNSESYDLSRISIIIENILDAPLQKFKLYFDEKANIQFPFNFTPFLPKAKKEAYKAEIDKAKESMLTAGAALTAIFTNFINTLNAAVQSQSNAELSKIIKNLKTYRSNLNKAFVLQ